MKKVCLDREAILKNQLLTPKMKKLLEWEKAFERALKTWRLEHVFIDPQYRDALQKELDVLKG